MCCHTSTPHCHAVAKHVPSSSTSHRSRKAPAEAGSAFWWQHCPGQAHTDCCHGTEKGPHSCCSGNLPLPSRLTAGASASSLLLLAAALAEAPEGWLCTADQPRPFSKASWQGMLDSLSLRLTISGQLSLSEARSGPKLLLLSRVQTCARRHVGEVYFTETSVTSKHL